MLLKNNNYSKNNININYINENKVFGFWIYLMSDCILFSTLFITYFVLHKENNYVPSSKDIFNIGFVLIETLILLISTTSYSIANLNVNKSKIKIFNIFISLTLLLGIIFLCMEFYEFYNLILEGYSPSKSAFLSILFVLLGTHGLHVFFGLIWILVVIINVNKEGYIEDYLSDIQCLGLFWHFLDIIWIFIFTFVYLLGII